MIARIIVHKFRQNSALFFTVPKFLEHLGPRVLPGSQGVILGQIMFKFSEYGISLGPPLFLDQGCGKRKLERDAVGLLPSKLFKF